MTGRTKCRNERNSRLSMCDAFLEMELNNCYVISETAWDHYTPRYKIDFI